MGCAAATTRLLLTALVTNNSPISDVPTITRLIRGHFWGAFRCVIFLHDGLMNSENMQATATSNSTARSTGDPAIEAQRLRRRTFAIISHPDAGKTTLTEKMLLFGGSIEIAGAVRGRKTQRTATSDWMELEKQRGISVSSTVLTFEFGGCQVNLLDTFSDGRRGLRYASATPATNR